MTQQTVDGTQVNASTLDLDGNESDGSGLTNTPQFDTANVFTAEQTFTRQSVGQTAIDVTLGGSEVLLSGDVKLRDYNDTGIASLAAWSNVASSDVGLRLDTQDTGVPNTAITMSADCTTLAITAADVTFGGDSLARLATSNVFTSTQEISGTVPRFNLVETDQGVDLKQWNLTVSGGAFRITEAADNNSTIAEVLRISRGAKAFQMSSTDVTYDGQSIARVGTVNVFTVTQEISGTVPRLNFTETDQGADLKKWNMITSNGDFRINESADDNSTITEVLRIFRGAKALQLSSGDITYDGQSLLSDAYTPLTINTQGGSYTLVLADAGKYVRMTSGSANTVTIPTNASVAFDIGTEVIIRQAGAGTTTIASSATINTSNTLVLAAQHDSVSLVKVATDVWDLTGSTA